jgi:hypothetical protein
LEATFGVSNVVIITVLVAALGIIILFASILVIAMAVAKWRRTFDAEIVEKKRFLLGESVLFKAFFKGKLAQGFFTCKVSLPNGRQEWWPAYDTFQRSEEGDLGVLSGQDVHEAKWGFQIPRDFPTGEYRVQIGVWDRKDSSADNAPVKEKSASFWVLSPGYKGSPSVSTVIPDDGKLVQTLKGVDAQIYLHMTAAERLAQSFVISTTQEPENVRMREIHVQLPSGEIVRREANFYIVSIGLPVGSENAQDFKLLLKNPYANYTDELWNISVTGIPSILVPWNFKQKPRPETCDDFAAAVLEAKIRHLTLTAGLNHLHLVGFVLFFTIRDCDAIYFPTFNQRKADMHTKFETALYAEATNRPQTLLKRFEIDAQRWDSVSVREL